MAVPKKRTSAQRHATRRATHRAAKPRLNECPRCHSPRLPHRVCPVCGTYAGREVISHEIGEAGPGGTEG
jgi:large subunit ribosomal protein L32